MASIKNELKKDRRWKIEDRDRSFDEKDVAE
jgi:hypothetical protein